MIAVVCLSVSWTVMRARSAAANALYRDNAAALNTALPNFSRQRLDELIDSIDKDKSAVAGLARIFYPKEVWLKKDYDVSILFVEGLNAANQALKKKADDKKLDPVTLDFASKLPSGEEAVSLLAQLKSLQEVVGIGMDLQGRFNSVKPLAIERVEGLDAVKTVRSSLEGVFPGSTVAEFLVRLRDAVPKIALELVDIKTQDEGVRVAMTISNVLANFDWQEAVAQSAARESAQEETQRAVAAIRGRNLFKVEQPVESLPQTDRPKVEAELVRRFFYRGKGTLRGAEVAVIEDVLAHETVFLKRQEFYGVFRLKDFSLDEAVLENVDDKVVTTIKRGE